MTRPVFGSTNTAPVPAPRAYACMGCDDLIVYVPGAGLPDGWVEVQWAPYADADVRTMYLCGACTAKRRKGQRRP